MLCILLAVIWFLFFELSMAIRICTGGTVGIDIGNLKKSRSIG